MLDLVEPQTEPPGAALVSPGGFAWWYADLVDADGSGAVLIWSYGLPFLPGYLSSARAGNAPKPVHRPSVHLSVFERGRPAYYLLRELDPVDASAARLPAELGGSALSVTREGGRLALDAVIAEDLPDVGSVRARLTVRGVARADGGGAERPDGHTWCPLSGPAVGRLELEAPSMSLAIDGSGYVDRNASTRPLDALGFARWTWGRAQTPDGLLTWYLLWSDDGEAHVEVLRVDGAGRCTRLEGCAVGTLGVSRSLWGLPRYPEIALAPRDAPPIRISTRATVDDGPFYSRHVVDVEGAFGRCAGVSEVCVPGRIDTPIHRWMASLCVHGTGPGSLWRPLFTGPARGRWSRWLGRRPAALPGAVEAA